MFEKVLFYHLNFVGTRLCQLIRRFQTFVACSNNP
jgi:hypothetical protein